MSELESPPEKQKPPVYWLILGLVLGEPEDLRGLADSLVSLLEVLRHFV